MAGSELSGIRPTCLCNRNLVRALQIGKRSCTSGKGIEQEPGGAGISLE